MRPSFFKKVPMNNLKIKPKKIIILLLYFALIYVSYNAGYIFIKFPIMKTIIYFSLIAFGLYIVWSGLIYGIVLMINKITNYKITWRKF